MSSRVCFTVVPAPSELSLFTAIVMIAIAFLATTGNLIVVLTIIIDPMKQLHTPFNYFLLNLALSDLLLGALSMPVGAVAHFQEYFAGANFKEKVDMKLFICMHVSVLISGTAGLLSLVSLSVDRLVAVTYPLKHKIIFTFRRCILICVCTWIFSILFPFLYFAWNYIGYVMFFMHAAIFVAFLIIVAVQYRITLFVKTHNREMIDAVSESASRTTVERMEMRNIIFQHKISRTYMMILFVFVGIYVPAVVMIYILHFCTTCDCTLRHVLRDVSFLLLSSNSCVNPFIYAIRLKKFRMSLCGLVSYLRQSSSEESSNQKEIESASIPTSSVSISQSAL